MATDAAQREYRAPCPSCGAPVEFRSAQSPYAVCGYCRSTVVREGAVLRRIGQMAELFDDHSPLQRFVTGRIALSGRELPFTLVGRLQYKGEAGVWSEWIAALEDGSTATLGEDNGAYVFTRPLDAGARLPDARALPLGATTAFEGRPWSVAYSGQAELIAAEGELPRLPPLGQPFPLVELRSEDGEVLSIDYGRHPPQAERGRAVQLADLRLQGLKQESVQDTSGRQLACPHCGAPVQVRLDASKAVTCGNCRSIINLEGPDGGALQSALQEQPVQPLIALGSTGELQGTAWQVVGFQQRSGQEPGDDETFRWQEYLLYNRQAGFAFLVDAEDGWSLVRPTTGAPQLEAGGQSARYLGTRYFLQSRYRATTTYVLGEFYWPVARGEQTDNRDFSSGRGLLSMEQGAREITWSAGDRIASRDVATAFGIAERPQLLSRADASPVSSSRGALTLILIVFALMFLLAALDNCSGGSSGYSRSSGGSFGGYSSGGSHK
ncbi:MAG TPA: DUF4178 domain-containing protein [Ottowia sp.]|uniref:DUF4178 domain-containing protein n=1 Tax=Ottowia sp. TaxID=1898956 RepID=UPI002C0D0149|nr:DUF4178 domain-containing protein [Ottowia sp.]HMN22710.1 DUF4178 domain-containing protein [Ottowia sp.]